MIDNDLNESGPAFPEFDERGARHYPGCLSYRRWTAAVAMDRRDAAFRLAFRRCGGVLPRFAGSRATHIDYGVDASAWYPGLTHAKVKRCNTR